MPLLKMNRRPAQFEPLERRRMLSSASPAPSPSPFSGTDAQPIVRAAALAPVAAPSGVVATKIGTTGLKLTWNAPSSADAARISKYRISYVPGAYVAGGGRKSIDLPASTRSATLSSLLPFTLYSIDISAIDTSGAKHTTHINAWTAAPSTQKRYLYLLDLPKNKQGFTKLKPQIEVFDVNNGHKWVKNIPLPSGMYGSRGIAANSITHRLYFTFYNTAVDTYQTGGLCCVDLVTGKVLWTRRYDKATVPSPDRFDITPDGKTIYMPVGENGPDNFWRIIDASTGAAQGSIIFVTAPHNTIVSVDGTRAFLEGQEKGTQPAELKHTIGVVDTATNKIIKRIGPFKDVVRPFTINGKASLVFANVNNLVGFQIGDVASGKILYTVSPPSYVLPNPPLNAALSHGIALTPDEKQIWVTDDLKVGIHVWDISKTPSQAPKYLGFIKTRGTGRNLAGQKDPAASNDASGVPAWIVPSYDGKYMYPESGEIIDVATRKVIGQLRAKTKNSAGELVDAPYSHSRFMLEVDFDAGKVIRVTDQFGVGKVR